MGDSPRMIGDPRQALEAHTLGWNAAGASGEGRGDGPGEGETGDGEGGGSAYTTKSVRWGVRQVLLCAAPDSKCASPSVQSRAPPASKKAQRRRVRAHVGAEAMVREICGEREGVPGRGTGRAEPGPREAVGHGGAARDWAGAGEGGTGRGHGTARANAGAGAGAGAQAEIRGAGGIIKGGVGVAVGASSRTHFGRVSGRETVVAEGRATTE